MFLHASKGRSKDKLNAKIPDVYRGRSYLEFYNFCQQSEDHLATVKATGLNWIPFSAFFLWDRIHFHWQQHKRKLEGESLVLMSWDKLKAFFRKASEDSQAFMNSYWTKIKQDSQYQQEDVLDWATHLDHLQAVLKEFDLTAIPNKETLIRYFRDGLRPFIWAQ